MAWYCPRSDEPSYQGKTLTLWLLEYLAVSDPGTLTKENGAVITRAEKAVRNMGTNSLPYLIRLIQTKDSLFRRIAIVIAQHQSIVKADIRTEEDKRVMADFGFYALGPMAKSAVPALVELLKDKDFDVHSTAANSLGNIGPDAEAAVPFLLPYLNSTNQIGLEVAALNLGRIHAEPQLVVPALVEKLIVTNSPLQLRVATIDALASFGERAKIALPYLIPFLSDSDEYVRSSATNAVMAIDSSAAWQNVYKMNAAKPHNAPKLKHPRRRT